MKKTILFTTIAVLTINIAAGLLLSNYNTFNMLATSVVVIITAVLLYITESLILKDAFSVSLSFFFSIMGIVMFLLMIFSKKQLQDNWCVMVSLVLMLIEAVVLYVVNKINNKIN